LLLADRQIRRVRELVEISSRLIAPTARRLAGRKLTAEIVE
jgi:hypothetical protein